jgi:hypothetical protein
MSLHLQIRLLRTWTDIQKANNTTKFFKSISLIRTKQISVYPTPDHFLMFTVCSFICSTAHRIQKLKFALPFKLTTNYKIPKT